jgi:hypothetical protein
MAPEFKPHQVNLMEMERTTIWRSADRRAVVAAFVVYLIANGDDWNSKRYTLARAEFVAFIKDEILSRKDQLAELNLFPAVLLERLGAMADSEIGIALNELTGPDPTTGPSYFEAHLADEMRLIHTKKLRDHVMPLVVKMSLRSWETDDLLAAWQLVFLQMTPTPEPEASHED